MTMGWMDDKQMTDDGMTMADVEYLALSEPVTNFKCISSSQVTQS